MKFINSFICKTVIISFIFVLMSAVGFLSNNVTEAKADIKWTTTDVILESGKCTVKGYFTNYGDTGAKVTNMKFIVDVTKGENGPNIYSNVWNYKPTDCYISAGSQKSWNFWLNDKKCPRYTKDDSSWSVNITWNYE